MATKDDRRDIAYNPTHEGEPLLLGSFFGFVDASSPPETKSPPEADSQPAPGRVKRFISWICDASLHQYTTQPEQPTLPAVSQSAEV